MMIAKIFYHGTDLDGYASGHIAKKYVKDTYGTSINIEMYPVQYGVREPEISDLFAMTSKDIIIIADWSFTEQTVGFLEEAVKRNLNIIWCDHHESSIQLCTTHYELMKSVKGIRLTKQSGAFLLYQYLYDTKRYSDVPYWIRLVSDYDTFRLELEDSKAFNYGILNSGKHDPRYDNSIYELLDSGDKSKIDYAMSKHIRHGKQILKFLWADNRRYLNTNGFECKLNGYSCLACNKTSNSLLFDSNRNEYDLYCAFAFDGMKWKYSIYSTTLDCSVIAEQYGGGGHMGAAGFSCNELIFTDINKYNNELN